VGDSHFTVTTKGGQRVRYPITPPVRAALDAARRHKAERGVRSDYVFITQRGTPWTQRTFNKRLKTIVQAAGVPHVTPHRLRHLYATLAATLGYSPDYLQAALGHRDRRSAEAYVEHTQAMRDRVAQVIAEILAPVAQLTTRHADSMPTPEPKICRPSPRDASLRGLAWKLFGELGLGSQAVDA